MNGEEIRCEKCDLKDTDILTIHHIDNNKKNNDINNLLMLCYNCHYKIHHKESMNLRNYLIRLNEVKNAFIKIKKQKSNSK
jgi:hypothetical protein